MPRSGTLVICVQNLDFSGANQVVLNIVSGRVHSSNVVVLSPKMGTFAARFVDSGAAVRVGDLDQLLQEIRDVFCIICNTIMTANIVVEYYNHPVPVIWILHEWWDDEMIVENLRIRNYKGLDLAAVKDAMAKAANVVCVCESQRQLYKPTAPSSVIFVGVPDPIQRLEDDLAQITLKDESVFTVLCLGIICPRKNQIWTVEVFKEFAKDRQDVRLKVVGARYTRAYEVEYLDQLKRVVGDDPRIEVLDVTDNVEPLYREADCLMLTSLNEVTPMVISEALSWNLPVLSTNIAGIKEMYVDGEEGYLFSPEDRIKALFGLEKLYSDESLRMQMGKNARARFESTFDLDIMVDQYRDLINAVAPPTILIDMDGVIVDWDKGFMEKWADRCPINRNTSYYMEDCVVDPSMKRAAEQVFTSKGFFEELPPLEGSIKAVKEMVEEGFQVYLCTSPIRQSQFCAQEKLNWVVKHLGDEFLNRVILCQDKVLLMDVIRPLPIPIQSWFIQATYMY